MSDAELQELRELIAQHQADMEKLSRLFSDYRRQAAKLEEGESHEQQQ